MIKKIFALLTICLLLANIDANAQKVVNKIKLSGFNVTLVPASEFSYTYDEARPTSVEVKGENLVLKANDQKNNGRSSVTINFVDIQSLSLENCELIYSSSLQVEKLKLTLDAGTTVNLQANIKSLEADVKQESKLGLEGTISAAKVKLDKASTMNSYDLKSDKFSLSASAESTAHLGLHAKDVSLEAKGASMFTLTGKTKTFKAKTEKGSRIDATGMEVEKATITSKGMDSKVIVKAKELKSNTSL